MIGVHHNKKASRGRQITFLRWAGAALVLGALFYVLPTRHVGEALRRVPLGMFLAAVAGYLLAHIVGIFKWRMVVNAAGARLDFPTSTQCYAGGLFATLFLPSILGGDVVRLAVGLRKSPNPAAVLAGNAVDRLVDVAAQAGLVALGAALLPGALPASIQSKTRLVLLILFLAIVSLAGVTLMFRRLLLGGRSIRFRRRLARLRHALRSVSGAPHLLGFAWMLGTGIQATFLLLNYWLAMACGLRVSLRSWLFAWPLAKLAAVLPLTQGGIGVREAVLVGALTPFGAASELVFASGLVWEGVIILGGLMAGLVALLARKET